MLEPNDVGFPDQFLSEGALWKDTRRISKYQLQRAILIHTEASHGRIISLISHIEISYERVSNF